MVRPCIPYCRTRGTRIVVYTYENVCFVKGFTVADADESLWARG